MRFDWSRAPRGVVLLVWAAFFDWLWLSDGAGRYVGPRTSWVIPFGGIVLTFAGVLYLVSLRRRTGRGAPPVRESLGALVLLVPLMLVAAAPAASLGALAVERKRSSVDQLRLPERATAPDGPAITLYDLAIAATSPDFARDRGIREGTPVSFDGFVSDDQGGGAYELSRFLAACCAADAMPYSVQVQAPAGAAEFERDEWVRVTGIVVGVGGVLRVVAERIDPSTSPDNPYSYGT